jgi:hypothetical protein
MNKTLFASITAMAMSVYLLTACAEEGKGTETGGEAESAAKQEAVSGTGVNSDSLMDQPVDFSTPEAAEKTLQNIREQEGEKPYKKLQSAMQYAMFYDLSVGNNKEKLLKKLDGKTPNEIVAMTKR